MENILIEGGQPLEGTVEARGSKNAALPILFATLLADDRSTIHNVPVLQDVTNALETLRTVGMHCERRLDGAIEVEQESADRSVATCEPVRMMRASVCTLGPLLARRRRAKIALPGGCGFCFRPIDLHLKGLAALGADVRRQDGYVEAEARELRGGTVFLGGPHGSTVLGTANVMMAAVLAKGTTVIEFAACEPEIADLASFLQAMGAKIEGAGTPRVVIDGIDGLRATEYTIIPDRIEAGTLLIAAAITRGDVIVRNVRPDHMIAVVDTLREVGVDIVSEHDAMRVRPSSQLHSTGVTTHQYPGFPTDLQAQMMVLLSLTEGMSRITERVFPDRFGHIEELIKMGLDVQKEGPTVFINGGKRLTGARVTASDLRASASLILAGLVAEGITQVGRIDHLDRGYERIEDRLRSLGAHIKREPVRVPEVSNLA